MDADGNQKSNLNLVQSMSAPVDPIGQQEKWPPVSLDSGDATRQFLTLDVPRLWIRETL